MKNRAAAIITRNGKLLVFLRRKPGREYYSLPGGGAQLEETFADACRREVKEETGLDVIALELVLKYVSLEKEEQFFHVIVSPGEPVLGGPEALHNSPENHYEFAWIDAAQLPHIDLTPAAARRVCLEILERQSSSGT